MRLSSMSWRISSAFRKPEKGRKRRAQQRASTQVDITSEQAGTWGAQIHADTFKCLRILYIYKDDIQSSIREIAVHLLHVVWQPDTFCRKRTAGP